MVQLAYFCAGSAYTYCFKLAPQRERRRLITLLLLLWWWWQYGARTERMKTPNRMHGLAKLPFTFVIDYAPAEMFLITLQWIIDVNEAILRM